MTDRLTSEQLAAIEAAAHANEMRGANNDRLTLVAEVRALRIEVEAAKAFGGGFYGETVEEETQDAYRKAVET